MDVLSRARKGYTGEAGSVSGHGNDLKKAGHFMAMRCNASVSAVCHLLRGTANLTLTSDES